VALFVFSQPAKHPRDAHYERIGIRSTPYKVRRRAFVVVDSAAE
jgi:hypothetical protein